MNWPRFNKILLYLLVGEICLGGGGRLTAFGPVSLRMILFSLAVVASVIQLRSAATFTRRHRNFLIAFMVVLMVGTGIGMLHHSTWPAIIEDVKPLSFMFILPFLAIAVDKSSSETIAKIFKVGALLITVAFVLILILIHSGTVPFLDFYRLTLPSGEFFYRGELSFFYKGFLFFGVGCIHFFFDKSPKRFIWISILLVAILLSVTRGLLVAVFITLASAMVHERRIFIPLLFLLIGIFFTVYGNSVSILFSRWKDHITTGHSMEQANPDLLGARGYSDEGRRAQLKQVLERSSFSSAIVGHGFGQGIPARPVHMEITYLEVWHKQGLLGLLMWCWLAVEIWRAFRQSDQSSLAKASFYSAVFVFVQSGTNQYVNNPIGMMVVLLAWVSLGQLKKQTT